MPYYIAGMRMCVLAMLFTVEVFLLHAQNRYAVVIDEIMADPSPQVGLPNNEWVELKNTTSTPVNLQGWRIGDRTSLSGPMPSYSLLPDSFVIVCSAGSAAALSPFGTVIIVSSFPSLDNDGDLLYLKSANGPYAHAVEYSSSWYGNELKKLGGWSLEMMDTKNPCSGYSNWNASTGAKGGTPGQQNATNYLNADKMAPELKNSYTTDSINIIITFNEPVDSASGAIVSNYSISNGVTISQAIALPPLFNQVQLKVSPALQEGKVYTIAVAHVMDCSSNVINEGQTIRTGVAVDADTGELVINEILFNPRPNGYDYIEFFNKSSKIFNAENLSLANRNSNNTINAITPVSNSPFDIFPGDYIVITENADNLELNYLVKDTRTILTLPSLPSFPDEKGSVILLNHQGRITDEVDYDESWHFKLLTNKEGVSLERINPSGPSQSAGNWHSAASTAGYGTPGYKNSQYFDLFSSTATVEITPAVFSPDNDGSNDIATIHYKTDEPGYIANVIIFDAAGRPVKNLARHNILGRTGYWNWDGLSNEGQQLPNGIYVVFTEIFNLQRKKQQFKKTLVLARKLH